MTEDGRTPRRATHLAGICAALVLVTFAAFHGVLSSGFVNYDDDGYVTENPHVRAGLRAESVAWAFTTTEQANWHPLTWLAHMLDVQLFGLDAGKHHRTSLLLHAASAVLLFLLLVSMTGALWPSAFVAALFAIHPLHVESVAWIAERKDVLSTLFWLLTLGAWLFYVESRTAGRYALVLVLYALGLMAKPMLVTLPFTLLLLDLWPLRRLTLPLREASVRLPGLLREKAPLFAMSAASCIVTFAVQRSAGAVQTLRDFAFAERLANSALAYVAYLGRTFWPTSLAVFYPYPAHVALLTWPVAGSGVLLVGITALALLLARRAPYVAFGWLWYLGTLVPVIGLVQVGGQARADRYTYVPLIGVFVIAAWGLEEIGKARRSMRNGVVILAAGSIVALSAATRLQVAHWTNGSTLYEHALAVSSDNWLAHNNLGRVLFEGGQSERAIAHYEAALRISPGYADAHYNLGIALGRIGRRPEAIEQFLETLRLEPSHAMAHNNLGGVLSEEGRLDEAVEQYDQAMRLDPRNAEAPYNLGNLLFHAGRLDEAIEWYEQALRLRPDRAQARNNLGNALAMRGRTREAIDQYGEALKLNPGFFEVHNNLGVVLAREGKVLEAIDHYRQALRIEPGYAEAANNLGLALASQDRWPEAIENYERALRSQPRSAGAHNNLGVALAHADRIPEALAHFEQAVAIEPTFEEARANLRGAREALRSAR